MADKLSNTINVGEPLNVSLTQERIPDDPNCWSVSLSITNQVADPADAQSLSVTFIDESTL